MQHWHHHRPLASFSTMRFYTPQPHPQPQPITTTSSSPVVEKPKVKFIIKKKHTPTATTTSDEMPAVPAIVTPVTTTPLEKQKQKIKITIGKRKPSFTEKPPTNKIKITIKKKPTTTQEEKHFINHNIDDIAPPVSMIYVPRNDYITPPPKCCRFFIQNRHCFLRSTDNACIDPINKEVFGFWNCEIGKKCELLPPPPTDDQDCVNGDDNVANLVQLDNDKNDDDCNKITALAMRQKSDANRARFTGQPVALLRQKIATNYGMHSFNSLGNRR